MDDTWQQHLSRRRVLQLAGLAITAGVLEACGVGRQGGGAPGATASPARVTSPVPAADNSATKLVGDVVDFRLRGPFMWNGGSVTMKLHEAFIDSERAYFVRTDASDQRFAREQKLVFVPLLSLAAAEAAPIYLFEGGSEGQLPVLTTVPGRADFTPVLVVHRVTFDDQPFVLDSAAKVASARADGRIRVEETPVIVNYPAVKWPGGELPVDTVVEKPLDGGPLLSAPDTSKMVVTFKLHQCFPESRYIVTDTSAVPMAPMMNIQGSPRTGKLVELGAASKITVFGNGLPGPGAMGFQPGIFREKAGDPAWSPLWDHWTAVWSDGARPSLVKTQADLDARVDAGEIKLHKGTPDTAGVGFVVNCPSPIVAPNDFVATGG